MIDPLSAWSWEPWGPFVTLVPPEGMAAGVIRYIERLRPLWRIGELMRQLETPPSLAIVSESTPEMLITREGEYGALVVQEAVIAGKRVQRCVGFVFGDDFYSRVVGVALRPDQFERFATAVKVLVESDIHALGNRRRRFLFEPPLGWIGLCRGGLFHAYFYPSDFPRNPSELVVCPAWPAPDGAPGMAERLIAAQTASQRGFTLEEVHGPDAVEAAQGLRGTSWELVLRHPQRPHQFRNLLLLQDERYVYPMHIDSSRDHHAENKALLERLLKSVCPIPAPQALSGHDPNTAILMSHWVN